MPTSTTIYSSDDLKPFVGKFVKLKHLSRGIHRFKVGLIVEEPNDGEFSPYAVCFPVKNGPYWTLEEWESSTYTSRCLISDFTQSYIKFSQHESIIISELSKDELQKQILLFQTGKRRLLPIENSPYQASAIKILQSQLSIFQQAPEVSAEKVSFQTIIKEIFDALNSKAWKQFPIDSDDSDMYLTAVNLPIERFYYIDKLNIIDLFHDQLKSAISALAIPDSLFCYSVNKFNFARAQLMAKTFVNNGCSPESLKETNLKLCEHLLKTSNLSALFYNTQAKEPNISQQMMSLFSPKGVKLTEMKRLRFPDDPEPYAGKVVFYEMIDLKPQWMSWGRYEHFVIDGKSLLPAYISNVLRDSGSNYNYTLTQFDCNGGDKGKTFNLNATELNELRVRLRLPNDHELDVLKKAYCDGRIVLSLNGKRCSSDEFSSLTSQQSESCNIRVCV